MANTPIYTINCPMCGKKTYMCTDVRVSNGTYSYCYCTNCKYSHEYTVEDEPEKEEE